MDFRAMLKKRKYKKTEIEKEDMDLPDLKAVEKDAKPALKKVEKVNKIEHLVNLHLSFSFSLSFALSPMVSFIVMLCCQFGAVRLQWNGFSRHAEEKKICPVGKEPK